MDNLRDKIAHICRNRGAHQPYVQVADAILALPEIADLQARAEAAEAVVEQLTNDPDYLTVYRKGVKVGEAKLVEMEAALLATCQREAATQQRHDARLAEVEAEVNTYKNGWLEAEGKLSDLVQQITKGDA